MFFSSSLRGGTTRLMRKSEASREIASSIITSTDQSRTSSVLRVRPCDPTSARGSTCTTSQSTPLACSRSLLHRPLSSTYMPSTLPSSFLILTSTPCRTSSSAASPVSVRAIGVRARALTSSAEKERNCWVTRAHAPKLSSRNRLVAATIASLDSVAATREYSSPLALYPTVVCLSCSLGSMLCKTGIAFPSPAAAISNPAPAPAASTTYDTPMSFSAIFSERSWRWFAQHVTATSLPSFRAEKSSKTGTHASMPTAISTLYSPVQT
mmetsp:Transcript_22715/g.53862  ORF Transcript_22715/g.53862 Transcript_22715/m.53862 type:complete len:267 (+) Transcript_22715:143-943(+)